MREQRMKAAGERKHARAGHSIERACAVSQPTIRRGLACGQAFELALDSCLFGLSIFDVGASPAEPLFEDRHPGEWIARQIIFNHGLAVRIAAVHSRAE